MRHYVLVDSGVEIEKFNEKGNFEDKRFASETRSLLYLYREENINKGYKECFLNFHDFAVDCGMPMASILSTNRTDCRRCKKTLVADGKPRIVVFLSYFLGNLSWLPYNKMLQKMQDLRALWVQD